MQPKNNKMTLEEQIKQEVDNQIKDIKKVFPNMGEQELKYISTCLKQSYVNGSITALSKTITS